MVHCHELQLEGIGEITSWTGNKVRDWGQSQGLGTKSGTGNKVRDWEPSQGLGIKSGTGNQVRDWGQSQGLGTKSGTGDKVRDCMVKLRNCVDKVRDRQTGGKKSGFGTKLGVG